MNYQIYTFTNEYTPEITNVQSYNLPYVAQVHSVLSELMAEKGLANQWGKAEVLHHLIQNDVYQKQVLKLINQGIQLQINKNGYENFKKMKYEVVAINFLAIDANINQEIRFTVTLKSQPLTLLNKVDKYWLVAEGDRSDDLKNGKELTDLFLININSVDNKVNSFKAVI